MIHPTEPPKQSCLIDGHPSFTSWMSGIEARACNTWLTAMDMTPRKSPGLPASLLFLHFIMQQLLSKLAFGERHNQATVQLKTKVN